MSESLDPPIRKFNPGLLQSDDAIRTRFVVRHKELEDVLERFRTNMVTPSRHNILITGDRGQGKTMLLSRIAAALRADPKLTAKYLPVRFMEENHEVLTAADFWLEVLFYLAREVSHDTALQLGEERTRLAADWRAHGASDRAYATVLTAATTLKRRLVLMVENLQDLLPQAEKAFISQLAHASHLTLVATTTDLPDALPASSFDLFDMTLRLGPLNEADCRALWNNITGATVPDDQTIRPIQILTGGNPRLLAMVAGLRKSSRKSPRHVEDFVDLLDEHTEYFRGRIATLPTIERRVYLAVASAFASPGDIAVGARTDIRTTSAMLGRLVARGMVGFRGSTRKREYRVTESVLALYYTARRTRDVGAIVRALNDIMPAIYPSKTRQDIADMLAAELPALDLSAGQVNVIRRALLDNEGVRDAPAWWLLETAGGPLTSPVGVGAGNDALPKIDAAVALLDTAAQCSSAEEKVGVYDRIIERYGHIPEARAAVAEAFSGKLRWQRDEADAKRTVHAILERFVTDRAEHDLVAKLGDEGRIQRLVANSDGHVIALHIMGIGSLPDAIETLTSLESLRVNVTDKPARIPHTIGQLAKLQALEVWSGGVAAIPDSIGKLTELTILKIMTFHSGRMPETIGNLAALEHLSIYGQSGAIPDTVGNLEGLQSLILSGEVERIPAYIGRLTNLRELTLRGHFTEVPADIGGLTGLRALRIKGRFKRMPTTMRRLEKLRRLEIGKCVSRFPAGIGRLKELQELSVGGTFRVIPDEVGSLSQLRSLELVGRFAEVPESIGELAELQTLRLGSSDSKNVSPLPRALTRLGKLEYLWATAPHAADGAVATWLERVNHSTLTSRLKRWRSLYEEVLVPGAGNLEGVLSLIVDEAVTLVAEGAAEQDVLGILSSDEAKRAALLPLDVALKMRLGVDVAESVEVEEVATDIRKRIEDRKAGSRSRRPWGLLLR